MYHVAQGASIASESILLCLLSLSSNGSTQSEVEELQNSICSPSDVVRLQVAVNYMNRVIPLVVQVAQSLNLFNNIF